MDLEEGPTAVPDDLDAVQEILSNAKLSEHYLALARDLDVMEAKTPEDIYKSHLVSANYDLLRLCLCLIDTRTSFLCS